MEGKHGKEREYQEPFKELFKVVPFFYPRVLSNLYDIFKFKNKRVVISGSAGIGKTTLIDFIAYNWALDKSETLNKYELVFVLKMCSLNQSSDLVDAIFDQLLDKNSVDQSALKKFIDKNQDKVLIILDGFDEFQTTELDPSSFGSILKVLNRKQGRECWVVITSVPPLNKLVNSSLVEMPYTHVAVDGFSYWGIEDYVNKYFPNDPDKASKLIQQIQLSDTLSALASTPMLLLLMCLLWKEENTLPDTMTQLYNEALKYMFKRKERDITDNAISKILISIGKVALRCLLSKDQKLAFREGNFEKSELSAAMNAGLLTSERVIERFGTYQSVSFIHHTFLEYCAAMYWRSLINTEGFDIILDRTNETVPHQTAGPTAGMKYVSDMKRHASFCLHCSYLLQFCCGDNEACTNRILQSMHENKRSELAVICYFESQSKKPPPENVISLVLTGNIDTTTWDDYSTKAFFYFLKHVTALSGGNDYFTKVTLLVMARFNFQRFGKDLAKALKLMTNLQRLSLEKSSLTIANTKHLLSSLASPSKLAELDLSENKDLGGSVSLLAPQLAKLKRLKKLHLGECSVVDQDKSFLDKSMGGTQVILDLTMGRALTGGASNWDPELGKVEGLQCYQWLTTDSD